MLNRPCHARFHMVRAQGEPGSPSSVTAFHTLCAACAGAALPPPQPAPPLALNCWEVNHSPEPASILCRAELPPATPTHQEAAAPSPGCGRVHQADWTDVLHLLRRHHTPDVHCRGQALQGLLPGELGRFPQAGLGVVERVFGGAVTF